jgi:hypothetical protein
MENEMSNRHYVDRLADIREKIRLLKQEEEELREFIIAKKQPVIVGSEYVAHIIEQDRRVINTDKVKLFLADRIDEFMRVSTNTILKIVPRKETDRDDFL